VNAGVVKDQVGCERTNGHGYYPLLKNVVRHDDAMGGNSMIEPQDLNPEYASRIVIDPKILHGKPAINGTRIPVSLVLNLLAHGYSFEDVVDAYPIVSHHDIRASLMFASHWFQNSANFRLTDDSVQTGDKK
jgi:uncharacterized protein (DUF433 family)